MLLLLLCKICYLFKKFNLRTCNNMTKTIVFILQEFGVTAKKAGGNVTMHAQHRIITGADPGLVRWVRTNSFLRDRDAL